MRWSTPGGDRLPAVRSGVARLARGAGRRVDRGVDWARARRGARADATHPGTTGVVELFSRKAVKGWVSVPPGVPPTRVTLHLDDLQVTSTYASTGALDEYRAGRRRVSSKGPFRHLPGPGEEERNTEQELRWFRFRLDQMWRFCQTSTRVSVRVDGVPLPIVEHGLYLKPPQAGRRTVADLRARMRNGKVFSQKGKLQTSKQHDLEWQRRVLALFERTGDLVRTHHGYDIFFVYGTLLGAVREGTYIGHDVDFDSAYVSSETDPERVADELVDISLTLVENGLEVKALPNHLHIGDPAQPGLHIDLFHTYFDADGVLRFPFGVAGTSVVRREDWQGVRRIDWPGGQGTVPVVAEQVVAQMYGDDWRQPKPGFHWPRDRVRTDPGRLTRAHRSKVYWENFYAHTSYTSGSSFFEFVNARADTPGTVVDIGCGDGRDACAFGSAGRQVLGLDQAPVGVQHARAHADSLGLGDRVRFTVCDVAETEALTAILQETVAAAADEPVLFYLRFFLHSIPEDVQEGLMQVIGSCARPGDVLAAEFRTEKDEAAAKVHGQHYRRYQNGPAFGAQLTDRGFDLLHEEEGTGLSPYKGEDPVLYRVVARR